MTSKDIENQESLSTNQLKYVEKNFDDTQEVKENECLFCCGAIGICGLGLALFAGAICYLVFGIMFLVENYDTAKSCDSSSLWAYVLTAIILFWCRAGAKNSSNDKSDGAGTTFCTLICLGLIEAGLAIWGGVELWQKSCDDLSKTNLWTFGLATFCLQTICASLFLVIIPCCLLVTSALSK